MRTKSKWLVSIISVSLAAVALAAAGPGYHVVKTYKVGGEGGWDYLTYDTSGHRVFVSRGNHVMVLDGESGVTLGDIPETLGVHGIALAPDLGRGFTSNGLANAITIFDLKTLKPIGQAPTGQNPDAILYDPVSKRVFAFNGRSNNATAIDAASGQPVGTIPLTGNPEFAVTDGKGTVFVNIENKHTLTAIDSQKLSVKSNWDLPGCEDPSGLSMDLENRRLFAVCSNKLMAIVDADSGRLVTTVPIGAGPDASAFAPKTGLVFSSNGRDGTLTVVHEDSPDKFTVVANLPTESGARTMALDQDTGTVYLVTAAFGPATILSFILQLFRSVVRPVEVGLAALFALSFLLWLMRARNSGRTNKVQWLGGALLFLGITFVVLSWQYDAVIVALSPKDFRMTIWR